MTHTQNSDPDNSIVIMRHISAVASPLLIHTHTHTYTHTHTQNSDPDNSIVIMRHISAVASPSLNPQLRRINGTQKSDIEFPAMGQHMHTFYDSELENEHFCVNNKGVGVCIPSIEALESGQIHENSKCVYIF